MKPPFRFSHIPTRVLLVSLFRAHSRDGNSAGSDRNSLRHFARIWF